MNLKVIKATLLVAFIVLTVALTYFGLNSRTGQYDFKKLAEEKTVKASTESDEAFNSKIKNIGKSSKFVKEDILLTNDTQRLNMAIELLDTMQDYLYAAVLSEKLAKIQNTPERYYSTAILYLKASENDEFKLNIYKKAKENLKNCLNLNPNNLDAKVDLAVSIYNINLNETPTDNMELMQPALLLREVVAADSNHFDGQYYLAKLSVESNQLEKAIVRFKKLVSLQPQNLNLYVELIDIYKRLGNEKEVRYWTDKAQELTKKQ
jgi:tetratricopeptide (TPR) repeat protein